MIGWAIEQDPESSGVCAGGCRLWRHPRQRWRNDMRVGVQYGCHGGCELCFQLVPFVASAGQLSLLKGVAARGMAYEYESIA